MALVRRLLLVLLGVLAALGVSALPAAATVDDVVAALHDDPLYVSADSSVTPDAAVVRTALEDVRVPTYVVVVPQADVDAQDLGTEGLLLEVLDRLGEPRAVVVVVSDGEELAAGDGGQAGVNASAVLDRVLAARLDQPFGPATLTAALVDVVQQVDAGDGPRAAEQPQRSTRRTVGLVGLIAVAALGGGGWLYARAQRRVLAAAPLTRDDLTPSEPGWQGVPDR